MPDIISRPSPAETPVGQDGLPIELEADEVEAQGKDIVKMRGNAQLKRGREAVFGDELTYYRATDEVEGSGNVVLHTPQGDRVKTDYVKLQVETHIGEADNVEYRLAKRDIAPEDPERVYVNARGTADKMYLEGQDVARFENVTYTTCVEGDDSVWVSAKELTLDQGTGVGVAKKVKVRFKKVPIFWFPRMSFPISDERKTGFLFPSFGAQEGSGFVLATPFYWNLAPNYDATLTPRLYTKRGVQLGAEFRYLTEDTEGYVYGEGLPSDSEFDDDRAAFTYKHEQKFSRRVKGDVDLQWVSDDQYFDDFSNDIQISSASTLPQRAELQYRDDIWRVRGRVFAYQVVDENISDFNEPFDRLPQIKADAKFPWEPLGANLRFDGEVVNFVHDERVEGWRYDATPSVSREFDTVWGYFEPKASLRHTSYNLENVAAGEDDSPSRTVPIFSVDSGLIFERRASWLDKPFIQTLEPRAFYVYIPEENQDDLPNFDTSALNLNNFSNIFRENRFFGNDRVGDTNQVTLGLTSRLIEADGGEEWMRASIGQIVFLEDREVNLNPGEVLTEDTSDLLAEVRAQLTNRWSTYGFVQWDDEESEVREGKADLIYRAGPRKFIDLEYRFSRDSLEQVALRAEWPLAPRWHLLLDERYSLDDDENLETKIGVEYDGCCWRIRAFGQRRVQTDETFRDAFIVEFELTGLARIRAGI